jgi:hypothetical protein
MEKIAIHWADLYGKGPVDHCYSFTKDHLKRKAVRFFNENDGTFSWICEQTNLDIEWVRSVVKSNEPPPMQRKKKFLKTLRLE